MGKQLFFNHRRKTYKKGEKYKQSNLLVPGELLAPMEVDSSPSAFPTTTILVSKRSHPDSVHPATTGPSAATAIDLYLILEEDAHNEEDILRDLCSSLNSWLTYLEFRAKTGGINGQVFVFERACKALPRSYKLLKWYVSLGPSPCFTSVYLFFCFGIVCCVAIVLVV